MSFSVSDGRGSSSTPARRAGSSPSARTCSSPRFHRMIARPAPLQPRGARLLGLERRPGRRCASSCAERRLLRMVRRAADRPPGVRRLVGGPGAAVGVPGRLPGAVLRQPRNARLRDRPRWRTVTGGSRRYVEEMTRPFADRIRISTPVWSVGGRRSRSRSRRGCGPERFDEVVIACHADQALALLADPTPAEREVLGAIPYQPKRGRAPHRRAGAAAAARGLGELELPPGGRRAARPTSLTYCMNSLQSLARRPNSS